MDTDELKWNFFELHVKLYEKYLDLVVKINAYYFALTGAMTSYCLAHSSEPNIKLAMLLPIVMGVSVICVWGLAIPRVNNLRKRLESISAEIELDSIPAVNVLKWFLVASIVVKGITIIGLLIWVFGVPSCWH